VKLGDGTAIVSDAPGGFNGWGFLLRHVVQWNRDFNNHHLRVVMARGPHFEFVDIEADRVEAHLRQVCGFADETPHA